MQAWIASLSVTSVGTTLLFFIEALALSKVVVWFRKEEEVSTGGEEDGEGSGDGGRETVGGREGDKPRAISRAREATRAQPREVAMEVMEGRVMSC